MIQITVNSKDHKIPPETTIKQLLDELKISKEGSAVAVNDKVVPRSKHETFEISDGDTVEIIRAVGGG